MRELLPLLGVYLAALVGLGALLSIPVFRRSGAAAGLRAAHRVGLLIVLPLGYFWLSTAMVPDWKGAARAGWLDGFHQGKLALSPLVLWGVVAAWAEEVLPRPGPPARWRALGVLAGALAADLCLLIGLFIHGGDQPLLMLVPVVTAAWFTGRAAVLLRAAPPGPGPLAALGAAALAQLGGALVWSERVYAALPDDPPDGRSRAPRPPASQYL